MGADPTSDHLGNLYRDVHSSGLSPVLRKNDYRMVLGHIGPRIPVKCAGACGLCHCACTMCV